MSKIHIKVGNLEIDFEGEEDFIKKDLLGLLEKITGLFKKEDFIQLLETKEEKSIGKQKVGTRFKLSTNAIARKLGAKTGPDLTLAACAHLSLVEKKETFSRNEILSDMKKATSYYKKSYGNNLTKYLDSVSNSGKLIERGEKEWALSDNAIRELEEKLA